MLTNFKGMTFYFISEKMTKDFGYLIQVENETLQFVPLETKLPFQYCELIAEPSNETCLEHFPNRQVTSFEMFFNFE